MKIVIFCGGYGTRMWPASRKSHPKQFFPLVGGKSLFQLTVARFRKVFEPSDIFVSTEANQIEFVKNQSPEIPAENIIAEPARRDNLAAVGLATALVEKRFPGEVMLASWSDQLVKEEDAFVRAVLLAGAYAKETGLIVSVDEVPTYPNTHLGWVEMGETLDERDGLKVVRIIKHTEKPDEEAAQKLFASGRYLLNTGYRAWRTDVMLSFYKEFAPGVYKGVTAITQVWDTSQQEAVFQQVYPTLPKDSIEYGIFEKLSHDKRATVPVRVGWKDVGTWELFYQAFATQDKKTVIEGGIETGFIDSDGNLVIGPSGKIIALIGVSDMVVVDTPDALLLCRMDKTAEVKELFARLEKTKPKFVE